MPLTNFAYLATLTTELEQRDDIICHKLSADGTTHGTLELPLLTDSKILFDLYDAEFLPLPLGLDGENILGAFPIHPNI